MLELTENGGLNGEGELSPFEKAMVHQYSISAYETNGFIMHCLSDEYLGEEAEKDGCTDNIHTHGLMNSVNRLDLQALLFDGMEIDRATAADIVDSIATEIVDGVDRGQARNGAILTMPQKDDDDSKICIYLMAALERYDFDENMKRLLPGIVLPVLRVIFLDPNGKYPWEEDCDKAYKKQIDEKDLHFMQYFLYPSEGNFNRKKYNEMRAKERTKKMIDDYEKSNQSKIKLT